MTRSCSEIDASEAALRRRLAIVVEDSNDAVIVQDLDGRILAWNRGAERMYGYSEHEALQMNVSALVPEGGRVQALRLLGAVARGDEVASLEVSRLAKDGRTLDVWLTTTALVDEEGRPVGVATTERDVTEHKRALAALRETAEAERRRSELLRRIANSIPDPVFVKDEQSRMLFANSATLEAIGKPAEEVLGRSDREFFDDEQTGATIVENDRRIMATGETVTVEERVETPGGRRWFLSTKAPLRDAAGKVTGIIGVTRDISARKRAEEALRESEERFRLLVQGVRDCAIYMLAANGTVTSWSAAAEQMFGYREEEIVGQHREVFFTDEQRMAGRPQEELEQALSTGRSEEEAWRVRKDGSRFWANVLITPLRDDGGILRGFGNVTRDFTERKASENALRESEERLRASEAALREADRQKNRFLATLSHELRNPLAPIRNSLYILDRAAPGSDQARRAQAIIDRQIGQMTWLIDDLLDVTRIAHGKIKLQRERLDLNELAHRTVEDHRTVFARSEVLLELLSAPADVWVDGDRIRLAQAVGNLLQNAAKFTPRAGKTTLSVEADRARGQAILTVRDTGAGIEPEILPRLFDAFAQADSTLDRSKGGLGLGLALVKGLVEMHGGSVSAASDGPGKGSSFTIALPLAVTVARSIPAPRRAGGDRAPRRVLVIEDNEDTANTLREVLELDEHVVEVAYTGREGIEKAQAFHPDVVLCDIGLPEMDGYEVARTMRADPEFGRLGLVALSGYAQPEDVEMAREAGFDVHIAKPPSIDTLERALTEVANARQHQPALQ